MYFIFCVTVIRRSNNNQTVQSVRIKIRIIKIKYKIIHILLHNMYKVYFIDIRWIMSLSIGSKFTRYD